MAECLFNSQSNNVVAYCHNHRCYMTNNQMECKNCLQKQCIHFEKNEDHPIWAQREARNKKRKQRKEERKQYLNKIKGNTK